MLTMEEEDSLQSGDWLKVPRVVRPQSHSLTPIGTVPLKPRWSPSLDSPVTAVEYTVKTPLGAELRFQKVHKLWI